MSDGNPKEQLKEIESLIGQLDSKIHALDIEDVFLKKAKADLVQGIQNLQINFRNAQQIFDVHNE